MYRRNRLRYATGERAHTLQTMPGIGLRMSNGTLPPAAEYDEWLAQNRDPLGRGGKVMTGEKLRRMMVMKRNGCSLSEIRDAVACGASTLYYWRNRLPESMK